MKEVLENLFNHNTLSSGQSKELLTQISKGVFNPCQISSFLTVFRMRGITVEELKGFRDALRNLCKRIDLDAYSPIDLCGTGGDGKDTFNISTLSSFVAAGAGAKVAKHGNYGVSSSCGSSNVLEHLGFQFTNNADKIERQIDQAGICFLHAPLFHPAMKEVAPIRRNMGVRTFFNMLGPMVNPAFPKGQLVGVFSLELQRYYKYLYEDSQIEYRIVHALDGYDEISLTGDVKVVSPDREEILSPQDFSYNAIDPIAISGGNTVEASATIFLNVLQGNGTEAQQAVVISNSGLAIHASFPNKTKGECIDMARESLESGKAFEAFTKLLSI